MKIPAMIERKFSKYPGPINWNKRVRDERQRAPNEFLKTGFQFFCFFYFFSMTGWQVELGAKDVQGSARLSKCLLNNAVVPKGKKGGKKIRVHSPPLPSNNHSRRRFRRVIQAKESQGCEFSGRLPVRQINSHTYCIQH